MSLITVRVVQPFVWNQTHLKVHPNGAAVFHEQKETSFPAAFDHRGPWKVATA